MVNCAVILDSLQQSYISYLARILNIIKAGNLSTNMRIFLFDQGTKLVEDIESKTTTDFPQISTQSSYIHFLKYFINQLEKKNLFVYNHTEENLSKLKDDLDLYNKIGLGKFFW